MLYCNNCKNIFESDEAKLQKEWQGVDERASLIYYHVCPNCNSHKYEKASYCKKCFEWRGVSEIENGICTCCRNEVLEKWLDFCLTLHHVDREILYSLVFNGDLDLPKEYLDSGKIGN